LGGNIASSTYVLIAGIAVRAATWFGWFIGVNQIMCGAESNQLIS